MEKQIKTYEIVFDSEYQGKIQVGMHIQLAECLEDALRTFTETNRGKAFFTGLKGLGEMIFEDYEKNRKKRID